MFKAVLLVCAQALMIQSIAGQCIGARLAAPCAAAAGPYGIAGPYGAGCGSPYAYEVAAIPASSGGGLGVSSASAIPPNGVSVLSENAIEGALAVAGALPFLGTVSLEGALPTAGAGAVNYGCGNGAVAILAEDASPDFAGPFGLAGPLAAGALAAGPWAGAYGPGAYGAGVYGAGVYGAGCGCGCGGLLI